MRLFKIVVRVAGACEGELVIALAARYSGALIKPPKHALTGPYPCGQHAHQGSRDCHERMICGDVPEDGEVRQRAPP